MKNRSWSRWSSVVLLAWSHLVVMACGDTRVTLDGSSDSGAVAVLSDAGGPPTDTAQAVSENAASSAAVADAATPRPGSDAATRQPTNQAPVTSAVDASKGTAAAEYGADAGSHPSKSAQTSGGDGGWDNQGPTSLPHTDASATLPITDGTTAADAGAEPGASDDAQVGSALDSGSDDDQTDSSLIALGPPTISGLEVNANPHNALSAYVSWSTDEPASSDVQFGLGAYAFHIGSEQLVTEHRVLVIGMYADSVYSIRAVSSNEFGSTSAEAQFTSGSLPAGIPVPQLTVKSSDSLSGWTLSNIQRVTTGTPALIVMYDEFGVPVWYYQVDTGSDSRGDISADLLDNGNVLIGPTARYPAREIDLGGNVVWLGPEQSGSKASHHAGKLANGNYILLRDRGSKGAVIQEVAPSNEVVWSWDLAEHHPPPNSASSDWCHANSVTIDEQADVLYLSCRWLGVFKAHRYGDQSIIWHMAADYGGEPGDVGFSPSSAQASDQHDPEIHDDGSILLYDNGGYIGGADSSSLHSRVVEYAFDEASKQATLVWEFPGPFAVDSWYTNGWYTPYWGDADRLSNGNILITAGMRLSSDRTRIFEVQRSTGQVVWEIVLPERHGAYRAQRLSPPPLVRPLASDIVDASADAGALGLDADTPDATLVAATVVSADAGDASK